MRIAALLLVTIVPWIGAYAKHEVLQPLAPGSTLPVVMQQDLRPGHVQVGERLSAKLVQRVPLSGGAYLPQKSVLLGTVVAEDSQTLTLRFDQLRLGDQQGSLQVRLVAAASWYEVAQTKYPLGATDRGTSSPADWTTMQIGRDEVYRSAGSGTVYNQYSEPVGHADLEGVYASPEDGAPPRALGPFSADAKGLYDLPDVVIEEPGGAGSPIVLKLTGTHWRLDRGTALLLEVVGK